MDITSVPSSKHIKRVLIVDYKDVDLSHGNKKNKFFIPVHGISLLRSYEAYYILTYKTEHQIIFLKCMDDYQLIGKILSPNHEIVLKALKLAFTEL